MVMENNVIVNSVYSEPVEVKGMKQTEIGLLPEDWNVVNLGQVADIVGGGTPSTFVFNYWNGNIEWFTPTEVGYSKYLYSSRRKITDLGFKNASANLLPVNSILLTTRAGIGDLGILKIEACTNQGFQSILCKQNFNFEFAYYLIATKKDELIKNASGSTFLEISPSKIKTLQIPLPPLPEQEAIAEALSDADAWIESLEKLIAKKRLIKQGAMQELLTPKEDWELINLGEKFSLKARIGWQGLTTAEYLKFGNYCLVTGTDFKNGFIDWESCVFVEKIRFDQDRYIQLKEKDVLVTKDGTIGKVAFVGNLPKPTTLNSGIFVVRPKKEFNNQFLYYILMSSHFDDFLDKITAGSTITHLYQKDFIHFKFYSPKSLTEQTRIAMILSDMDAELESLESQLAKARQIKQGMMQELLTGRVRLV